MDKLQSFTWDPKKDLANQKKHGVSFFEAAESFLDPKGFALQDEKHSCGEKRMYWIGRSKVGRILTTRFTLRGECIRIIGSGMWREFRELYYEKTK
jgi:uncharacterized DUF497 family protein